MHFIANTLSIYISSIFIKAFTYQIYFSCNGKLNNFILSKTVGLGIIPKEYLWGREVGVEYMTF